MVVAKSSIAYHLYLSLYTTNRVSTTLPILTGSGLYVASFYLYEKKYVNMLGICGSAMIAAVYLMGATWSCKLIMKNVQHVAAIKKW